MPLREMLFAVAIIGIKNAKGSPELRLPYLKRKPSHFKNWYEILALYYIWLILKGVIMWVSTVELQDLLGKDTTHLLCAHFGGVAYYIPQVAKEEHQFARIIGMPAFRVLCSAYHGNNVTFPNGRRSEPKRAAIIKMLDEGHSLRHTALALGVSQRWVESVASQTRQNVQLKLPL